MSSFRPAGVNDGSRSAPPVPVTAIVSAGYGDDPSKLATRVEFNFRPAERARVDRAVEAFMAAMEEVRA